MKIFLVLSNLNYSGDLHKKGSFIATEEAVYDYLVADGVLRLVEGAETAEEAEAILENERTVTEQEANIAPPDQNTWGPKKDEEPTAPADELPLEKIEDVVPGTVGQGDLPPTDVKTDTAPAAPVSADDGKDL